MPWPPLDHFEFTIRQAMLVAHSLSFSLALDEVYGAWCLLQTQTWAWPHKVPGSNPGKMTYSCVPPVGGRLGGGLIPGLTGCAYHDPKTGREVTVDCDKWSLCARIAEPLPPTAPPCACSAVGCGPQLETGLATFTVAIGGTQIDGTVDGLPATASVRNVHLKEK
jgi:hypothetical protein